MSKCEDCDGCLMAGVRDHSGNAHGAEIPSGWHCIERCDACERYAGDIEAALAWAAFHKLPEVRLVLVHGNSFDVAVPEAKAKSEPSIAGTWYLP